MAANKISLGQIGYGYWGQKLFGYFSSHPRFNVVKVAARDPKKERPGLNTEITSAQNILDDKTIQAVIVATPVETHFAISKQVLDSGKHLFCEKAFTGTLAEAEELKSTAASNGLKIMVDFTFTFSQGINKMIETANAGNIGTISSASFQMLQPGRSGPEGVYYILGSHMLSVLSMLFPLSEFSFCREDLLARNGIPESGYIHFSHTYSPFKGIMHVSLNHPDKTRKIAIYGSKGAAYYDMFSDPPVSLAAYNSANNRGAGKGSSFHRGNENDNLTLAVNAFYRMIVSAGGSNIDRALQVTDALERISFPHHRHYRKEKA